MTTALLDAPTEAVTSPLLQLVSDDVDDGSLSDEQLGSRIVGLSGRIAASTSHWLLLVAEFDQREAWNAFGLGSTARWLSHHCGITHRTAVEHVRVARSLRTHARLADEMAAGRISYSHARGISRVVEPEDTELVDALVDSAEHGTVGQLEDMVRGLRRVDREEQDEADRKAGRPTGPKDTLDSRIGPDGRWHLSARLAPEDGATVDSALAAVARAEGVDRVTALVRLAEMALAVLADTGRMPRELRGDERAAVVVHLDAADVPPPPGAEEVEPEDESPGAEPRRRPFARLAGGPGLPDAVALRLLCDGRLRTIVYETEPDGRRRVLDVGRCQRLVTRKQFRALVVRDGHRCTVPGCESTRRLHVHHVIHWLFGGLTDPDNEVLVCEVHHRKIHDGEIDVRAVSPGRFRWFRSDGGELVPHVDPSTLAANPAPADTDHLDVAATAAESRWDGTRLDRGYAVSCLADTKARRRKKRLAKKKHHD
ncbi:HNH endonuclease [Jatrophihabitans sp. YIM 134969]